MFRRPEMIEPPAYIFINAPGLQVYYMHHSGLLKIKIASTFGDRYFSIGREHLIEGMRIHERQEGDISHLLPGPRFEGGPARKMVLRAVRWILRLPKEGR